MELIVGQNTYVTLEEFKEYIKNNILSTDPLLSLLIKDGAFIMSDNDMSIYLVNSARQIDALPFIGRGLFIRQTMAFPRQSGLMPIEMLEDTEYGDYLGENIKVAQIKNALAMLPLENNQEMERRRKLQAQGVTGFSLDGFSESYALLANVLKVADPVVLDLLADWIHGSLEVR